MKHSNGMLLAALIYILFLLADLVSTVTFNADWGALEANPLYPYVGVWGVLAFNLAVVAILAVMYRTSDRPDARFVLITAILSLAIIRVLVVLSNLGVTLPPDPASSVQRFVFVARYALLAGAVYATTLLTYMLWRLDHTPAVSDRPAMH